MLYLVTQLCLTLYNLMDSSPPGSSVPWDSPGKNTGVGCCLGTGPSAQEARDAASRGPGEHPGGRGAEEERAQVAAPALSRALAGRDGSDTLGALSELGLESFHRWARALQGSEEGSLQRSLAAWSWGALGPVWV